MPIDVSVHKMIQTVPHSIPNKPIAICSPKMAAAVNPGINSPAMQNFNVGLIKLYFFLRVIFSFKTLRPMYAAAPS